MMRRLLKPFFAAPLSRRAILGTLARFGLLASAAPALSAATKPDADLLALAGLVRELVPHPLDEAVFLDAAISIRGAMSVTAREVDDGLRRLRAGGSGELPATDAFLSRMRTAAVEAIYRDPRTWDLIGYGGNALAKGGYTGNFDNIDWLPGERK